MHLSVNDARCLIEETLHAAGLPDAQSGVVADCLVEAELRGRPTHGLMRLPGIVQMCAELSGAEPEVVVDRGVAACVDGHGALGYVAATFAADAAARRAEKHGLALVALRNSRHTGRQGYYVERLAQRDLAALAFGDCRPIVAPYGGVDPVLGTNPTSAAFPFPEFPIAIDFGTSATTFGDVRMAELQGEALAPETAVDAAGRPTTDPAAAWGGALLPWGGHKGYALGLMAQLLAGAATLSAGLPTEGTDYGLFLLAFRPDLFGPRETFDREVRALVDAIRTSRKADGVGEILIPGERAWRERQDRVKQGIEISDPLLRRIRGEEDGPAGPVG